MGPLSFWGLRRSTPSFTPEDLRLVGGVKSPAIVRAGHTVTVSIDRSARDFVRISHGQFRRDGSGPRVKAHTIRFESCSRRRARSTVDGRPVTFWSGFFVIKRTPACLPLTITVDGGRPRRYRLPIGSVDCGPPRVRVPRLVGLGRGEAFGRLRAAGLRPSTYAGARRYEPNGDGLARRLTLVPAGLAGPRRVTVQGLRPWVPVGSPVAFGTQPAPGRYRLVQGLFGGDIEWVRSITARGRRLALELIGGDCDPVDHVDVAMRRRWVLLVPYVIGGRGCGRRDFVRRAELRLPEPLAGRPVLERPPERPDPTLVDQHPTRFDAVRPSPDGRSVVVFYTYGGCDSLAGASVREGRSTVAITLIQGRRPGAEACPAIAYFGLTLVELSSPLGSRRIVDGASAPRR